MLKQLIRATRSVRHVVNLTPPTEGGIRGKLTINGLWEPCIGVQCYWPSGDHAPTLRADFGLVSLEVGAW